MTDVDKTIGYRYWTIDSLGRLRSPYYREYIWNPDKNSASKLIFSGQSAGLYSWWDPRRSEKPHHGTSFSVIDGPELVFGAIKVDPDTLIHESTDRTMSHTEARIVAVVKPIEAKRDENFLKRKLRVWRTIFFFSAVLPILLLGLVTSLFWTHDGTGLWSILAVFIAWYFFSIAQDSVKRDVKLDLANRWKRFEYNYPEVQVFGTQAELFKAFPYPNFLDESRTPDTDPTFWLNP